MKNLDTITKEVLEKFLKEDCLIKGNIITVGVGNLNDFLSQALRQVAEAALDSVKMGRSEWNRNQSWNSAVEVIEARSREFLTSMPERHNPSVEK